MVTDEMVEKAAAGYWNKVCSDGTAKWPDDVFHETRDIFREGCRAALEAALSAAEPVAWRIVGKLDSGSSTWKVVQHEHQAREEAKSWEKMCAVEVHPLYAASPAPSVAVKALHQAASDFMHLFIQDGHLTVQGLEDTDLIPAYEKLSAALSARVQDVAEDGERVKAAFNHGYVIACCNITNLHDEPGIAHDTLRELGVTKAEVKKMGLCDYDAKALREIERARGPNSAVYAAAPAKQEG